MSEQAIKRERKASERERKRERERERARARAREREQEREREREREKRTGQFLSFCSECILIASSHLEFAGISRASHRLSTP